MIYKILLMALWSPCILFAQTSIDNINFETYIGDEHLGMRINPLFTGLKNSIPNQEIDLNFTFFYHDKYTLSEEKPLGVIEGRFISETPLSAFDPLEKIRKDNSLALSNYGATYKEYQKALSDFQYFQKVFDDTINKVDTLESSDYAPVQDYNDYVDDYKTDYEANETDETAEADYEANETDYEADETDYETDETSEADYEDTYSLNRAPQKMLAQSIFQDQIIEQHLPDFPAIVYTNKDPSKKSLNAEELEFLVRYETLKNIYNKAVDAYNKSMSLPSPSYPDTFDPADPAEEFTIMIIGDQDNNTWHKRFSLDGSKNYQSHDDKVWYLGYRLDLTKKDVRLLNNIFSSNTNIRYLVRGIKGSATFNLSPHFINATKELIDLYVRGKFINNDDSEYPMMRSN